MKRYVILFSLATLIFSGCAQNASKAQKGTGYGALGGAVIGAALGNLIGGDSEATAVGAAVGAGLGAAGGYGVGAYMDKQEADMRQALAQSEAVNIRRNQDLLELNFKGDLVFDVNSTVIRPGAQDELARVARVLNQYPQTTILIAGHTDSSGSEAYNQTLSERRAQSAGDVLVGQGVNPSRLRTVGYGEGRPIASNATAEGRQLNRRVEITIAPDPA